MNNKRKTLQELTIIDDFMFGAVMQDPEICRGLLECILEISIRKVEVIKEKSLIYHPEYRGVRLDVFANDEKGSRYDVEMQTTRIPSIERRSRYYHSQMDMEMLLSGIPYERLPDSYVIFICTEDPYDRGKYRYTFNTHCEELSDLNFPDKRHTVILNSQGRNPAEIPQELVNFLEFTKLSLAESEKESDDAYVRSLQKSIRHIKNSREMGEKYMKFQEMLQRERLEGREEGRLEGREEGREFMLFQLVEKGLITEDTASEQLGITPGEFRENMKKYIKMS